MSPIKIGHVVCVKFFRISYNILYYSDVRLCADFRNLHNFHFSFVVFSIKHIIVSLHLIDDITTL